MAHPLYSLYGDKELVDLFIARRRKRRQILRMAYDAYNRIPRYRKWAVRPMWRKRLSEGEYYTAFPRMHERDPEYFRKFFRMTPKTYDILLDLLHEAQGPYFVQPGKKQLPLGLHLCITLRYLGSTEQIQGLALAYRIGITTAAAAIYSTCELLWNVLQPLHMPTPTMEDWRKIAEEFETLWQFPHCLGAVDGKHIEIQAPGNTGSMHHNYKGTFSNVLMAVSDARYRFIVVDVGGYGRQSDGGTFKASPLGMALENNALPLPEPSCLATSTAVPYVFIGDEAFQLKTNFMRPYPGNQLPKEEAIFNYRLSRARRCVENTFGILSTRWRIFRRAINVSPDHVDCITKAACVLHNFLRNEDLARGEGYCRRGDTDVERKDGTIVPGTWRWKLQKNPAVALSNIKAATGHNYSKDAASVRESLKKFFCSKDGAVPWQWELPGIKHKK